MSAILIVGSKRLGAIEIAYVKALQRFGLQVDHFDPEQSTAPLIRYRIINRLSQNLQDELVGKALNQYLQTTSADYDEVIIFKGMHITPKWLVCCKRSAHKATWINLNPDDPFNLTSRGSTNQNVLQAIALYDMYVTWNEQLVPKLQAAGCPGAFFLPFAYDVDQHFPAQTLSLELRNVITFVGTWDQQREQLLTEIADFPLRIYGNFWDRIRRDSPLRHKISPHNLYSEALRQVISSSKASLNILRPQNYGAHNMRTFEIPAMRGLMLTTSSEAQNNFFPDRQASLMYKDVQDLRCTLEEIMAGTLDLDQIRETAFTLCRSHSYDARAETLHTVIKHYRATGQMV